MTEIVYFSGVHGAGKTSIIREVANKLRQSGLRVYVFSEFSYIPNISTGSMKFQAWYKGQMKIREALIGLLDWEKKVDFVLCDRHPIDVDVYTRYLLNTEKVDLDLKERYESYKQNYPNKNKTSHYIITRNRIEDILTSLSKRLENEPHRESWKEAEYEYVKYIDDSFLKLFSEYIGSDIKLIINHSIEESAQRIFTELVK